MNCTVVPARVLVSAAETLHLCPSVMSSSVENCSPLSQDAALFANYLATFRKSLLLPSAECSKKTQPSWINLNWRKYAVLKSRYITNQHGVIHQTAIVEQQHCENLRVHLLVELLSR